MIYLETACGFESLRLWSIMFLSRGAERVGGGDGRLLIPPDHAFHNFLRSPTPQALNQRIVFGLLSLARWKVRSPGYPPKDRTRGCRTERHVNVKRFIAFVRQICSRAALSWFSGAVSPGQEPVSDTAGCWWSRAACWGRSARWTTSRRRRPPDWTACRSGRERSPGGRLCRSSATPDSECRRPRRIPASPGSRSRNWCRGPLRGPGSPHRVDLRTSGRR